VSEFTLSLPKETKTGIQDAKIEYTGPQTHTGYRITVRYDGQNDNVTLILAHLWGRRVVKLASLTMPASSIFSAVPGISEENQHSFWNIRKDYYSILI
jgi:hypothetical protein